MVNYSKDSDLQDRRSHIMDNGEMDFTWAHTAAKRAIDSVLEAQWYKNQASAHGVNYQTSRMDADRLDAAQLKDASIFKALELIYINLTKDVPMEDGAFQWFTHWRDEYDREMSNILMIGPSYDWDDSGTIEDDEKQLPSPRTLKRA